MIDCDLLSKVYINLIDQKEPTLDLKNFNLENKEENFNSGLYYKKIIKPSNEELEKHKNYLKFNLKKNYF